MRLGPEENSENPLMVCHTWLMHDINESVSHIRIQLQYFTWESKHPTLSWWQHFGNEVPRLAEMGFTQVWLPPPNKAMAKVSVMHRR